MKSIEKVVNFLEKFGIPVKTEEGNYRPTYDVLNDISEIMFNDNNMIIPIDFEGKIIEKSWFGKDWAALIYFDENKWSFDDMQAWYDMISEFVECPVMLLPKSFSELKCLDYDQMLLLKNNTDKAIEKMNGNQDN